MIRGAVLFAIGALAVATLAASYLPGPAGPPAAPSLAAARPADEPAPRAADGEPSGFRETSLQADSRGQYAADVLVNGLPVRMIVDTGASVVAISASTAARLGLAPGPGPKWRIKTANGEFDGLAGHPRHGELRRTLHEGRPGAHPRAGGGRGEPARGELSQAARQRRAARRDHDHATVAAAASRDAASPL